MDAFFDERQWQHAPENFISAGRIAPSPEQPERIARLKSGAEEAGCQFTPPEDAGFAPIKAVHTPDYLNFLQTIHSRWQDLPGASTEVIPNVHPRSRADGYPSSPVGQAGYHQADTACPIGENTWTAAYWSAQTAISGADALINGTRAAYALCRPPGHHAFADQAGGFCFLNNAAIAAERLRQAGLRPAILDVDVHHGNGTQGIFYDSAEVLTVSVHTDPDSFYPFFWGHADERGSGPGEGFNLNLPLERGTGTERFLNALDTAFERIETFGATALVVAVGLDAHESDPFKGMTVTTKGLERIGAAIGALGLPTIYVQEGGYLSDALSDNLTHFLAGAMTAT